MKKRLAALALLGTAVTLPGMVSAATYPTLKPGTYKPMFVVLPQRPANYPHGSAASLAQWNGTYKDLKGNTVNFTQIGGNPATTNTTSTMKIMIIPIKMIYGSTNGNMTFDPVKVKLANNKNRSVVKAVLDSPLFKADNDFAPQGTSCTPNCVDLGKTQYEDAFQRGTWWGNAVGTNTSYHVLYAPTVLKEQSITVTAGEGNVENNPFGTGKVGLMNINNFDSALQTFMSTLKITPDTLPLFVTYDIYLTSGGCCIGGYHSANGGQPNGQTYSYATYVDSVGAFSQDVSALTHELGEWMDDPFADNFVNCQDNGLMEVGDPLERLANYGAFPYKSKGFTYNLQSLVYMPYFGAPVTDAANKWYALQDDMSHVCPGQ